MQQPEPALCRCLGITESEVRAAADYADCRSLQDIRSVTSAGTGCMACHRRIKAVLAEMQDQATTSVRGS